MLFIVCPDALVYCREGAWLFSNPRTRTHARLSPGSLRALALMTGGGDRRQWCKALAHVFSQDQTLEFYGENGLHGDHTGISKRPDEPKAGAVLFDLFVKRWLIVAEDMKDYQRFLAPLSSILDWDHLGTWHQRVGQFMTIKKRVRSERWRWWHDQKFSQDGLTVQAGPYKYIQDAFISQYFSKKNVAGLRVLDFGCGNGYYSGKLADFGADVVGLDMSAELITIARENHNSKARFLHVNSPNEVLDYLRTQLGVFDIIFMQDVLLLLLHPESEKPFDDLGELLSLFRTALKKSTGRLYCVEPNGTFFLAGRYGNIHNPYAIVTEYKDNVFNIAPPLSVVMKHMHRAGFALAEYLHPQHTDSSQADYTYVNHFCIWDFMCFVPLAVCDADISSRICNT